MFNEQRKDDYRHRDLRVIGQKLRSAKETELREETAGSDYQENGDAQHVKEYNQDDSGDDDGDDNDEI